MTDADNLLRAILETPLDDAPRLAFADWLMENGHELRGKFIKAQVTAPNRDGALGSLRSKTGLWHKIVEMEPWTMLADRVTVPTVVTLSNTGKTRVQFRRGFADRVWIPANMFMTRVEEVFSRHPITQVWIADPFPSSYGSNTWVFDYGVRGVVDRIKRNSPGCHDPWLRLTRTACPTQAEAEAALSKLLVEYGRAVAGLGPL